MPLSTNVATATPKITGAIFVAPLGTSLPTTADATLNTAFTDLGYVSEDGFTNSNTLTMSDIKEWGGQTVASGLDDKTESFKLKLIEVLNADVLKQVFGESNVSGTSLATGITVKHNATAPANMSYVVDMILNGTTAQRIVIPSAKLTNLGDVVYKKGEAIGYDETLTAYPDASGQTSYTYFKTISTTSPN